MNYPEHEKLHAIKSEAFIVQQFIDWLYDDANFVICQDDPEHGLIPISLYINREMLMSKFLGIDLQKLSQEKDQMLDDWREAQGL